MHASNSEANSRAHHDKRKVRVGREALRCGVQELWFAAQSRADLVGGIEADQADGEERPPVSFVLDNLESSSSYRLILFAVNAKGRSEPVIIDDISIKGVVKFSGEQTWCDFNGLRG
jgi:hypothetical protein